MKIYQKSSIATLAAVVLVSASFVVAAPAQAAHSGVSTACNGSTPELATLVSLGNSATDFGVIAAAAITNVGGTHLNGKIGVFPGTAITGIATIFTDTATALILRTDGQYLTDAQVGLIAANSAITGQESRTQIAAELGEQVVCPGIYNSDAALGLTGNLTLDGNNHPDSVFIFITPAALNSAAASRIILKNGAKAENVFWQIGAAATLGASSFFSGTILAQAAITVGAGVHVHGRLFSLGAAITLDSTCVVLPGSTNANFGCSEE
jgi:hypothetical protein